MAPKIPAPMTAPIASITRSLAPSSRFSALGWSPSSTSSAIGFLRKSPFIWVRSVGEGGESPGNADRRGASPAGFPRNYARRNGERNRSALVVSIRSPLPSVWERSKKSETAVLSRLFSGEGQRHRARPSPLVRERSRSVSPGRALTHSRTSPGSIRRRRVRPRDRAVVGDAPDARLLLHPQLAGRLLGRHHRGVGVE